MQNNNSIFGQSDADLQLEYVFTLSYCGVNLSIFEPLIYLFLQLNHIREMVELYVNFGVHHWQVDSWHMLWLG